MAPARARRQGRSLWGRLAEEFSYRRTLEERASLAPRTLPAGGMAMHAADSWLMERVRDLGSAWYRMRGPSARGEGEGTAAGLPLAGVREALSAGRMPYRSSYRLPGRLAAAALAVVLSGATLTGCGKEEPAQVEQPAAAVVVPAPVPVEPVPLEPAPVPEADAALPDAAGAEPTAGGIAQRPDPFVPPQTLEERVEPERLACDPQVPYRAHAELSRASRILPPAISGTLAGADAPSTVLYRAPSDAGQPTRLSYRSDRPLTITLPALTAQQRSLGMRYVLSGENAELIAREGETLTMPTGRTALRYISSEGIQVGLMGPDEGCGTAYASVRIALSYRHPPLEQTPAVAHDSAVETVDASIAGTGSGRGYGGLFAAPQEREPIPYPVVREPSLRDAQRADPLAYADPLSAQVTLPDAAWERGTQRQFSLFGPGSSVPAAYAATESCALACAPSLPAAP